MTEDSKEPRKLYPGKYCCPVSHNMLTVLKVINPGAFLASDLFLVNGKELDTGDLVPNWAMILISRKMNFPIYFINKNKEREELSPDDNSWYNPNHD